MLDTKDAKCEKDDDAQKISLMMTTSYHTLKRKANGSDDDDDEACRLSLLDEELSNPLVYIGSFLTGKDVSTFLSAVISSRHVKDHAMRTHLVSAFVDINKRTTDRCTTFLSNINAPSKMVALLNDRSENLTGALKSLNEMMYPRLDRIMNAVSEWGAFLDYCELVPLRLSKARLASLFNRCGFWVRGCLALPTLHQFYLFQIKLGDRN